MNRSDRREAIFRDDQDQQRYLPTLGEACGKTEWQVNAWCLMGNHFHLVIETPQANLVAGMKWFPGTYTGRFNRHHKLSGHLFSGRYKALMVDGSGRGYLKTVCDYVHLNPVRAKLLTVEQPLRAFVWSSYTESRAPGAGGLEEGSLDRGRLAVAAQVRPGKIKLAAHLREETTMTLNWIAQRLQMGAWTHLNKRLHEHRKYSEAMKVE